MREFVKNIFLSLVAIFLFALFLKFEYHLNLLYFHWTIEFIVLLLAIVLIVLFVSKLSKWMASLRYKPVIETVISLLLLVFFLHELFTPYFYQEDYLSKVGLEKIEKYNQLTISDLTTQEREKLSKEAVVKEMAVSFSITGYYPRFDLLENVRVIDFSRRFNQYELVIEGNHPEQETTRTLQFTFAKEGMGFKIIGFADLN